MKRSIQVALPLFFLSLLALGPAVSAGATTSDAVTMEGSFVWNRDDVEHTGDLTAVLTPKADGEWAVAFHFLWEEEPRTFLGAATGGLDDGPLAGSAESDDPDHKIYFRFSGTTENGTFRGTHSFVQKDGSLEEGGTLTLARATTVVLVAYHSETGNTEGLAKAVAEGVSAVPGVAAVLRSVTDASDAEISSADGILVGTPVHWANLHSEVKSFLDRIGTLLDPEIHGEGRAGGAFCTAGAPSSGKELARMAVLAAFLNMRFVVVGGVQSDGFGNLGAEATTGPADPGLSEAELEEARRSGERFGRITAGLARSR